jgi:hypothetical protein
MFKVINGQGKVQANMFCGYAQRGYRTCNPNARKPKSGMAVYSAENHTEEVYKTRR